MTMKTLKIKLKIHKIILSHFSEKTFSEWFNAYKRQWNLGLFTFLEYTSLQHDFS